MKQNLLILNNYLFFSYILKMRGVIKNLKKVGVYAQSETKGKP